MTHKNVLFGPRDIIKFGFEPTFRNPDFWAFFFKSEALVALSLPFTWQAWTGTEKKHLPLNSLPQPLLLTWTWMDFLYSGSLELRLPLVCR